MGGILSADWLTGNALSVDHETTGIDPLNDRIVQATCVEVGPSGVVDKQTWLVNPGIPIPEAASKVHGITDLMASAGLAPLEAVTAIIDRIQRAVLQNLPIIIMNSPYDLALLVAEARRIGHAPWKFGYVLDPLVIDRWQDQWRKGKRNLESLAKHYGVSQTGAHSSEGDALCAARIVWAQAKRHRSLAKFSLADMQAGQKTAHRDWATGFQRYLRKSKPEAVVSTAWPYAVES